MTNPRLNPANHEVDMAKYYEYRHKLRQMYKGDVTSSPYMNDLYSTVLELRDKYKDVDYISISTEGCIDVEFSEKASEKTINKVVNQVFDRVSSCIKGNAAEVIGIDPEKDEFLSKLLDGTTHNYCDCVFVGTKVTFYL